MSGLVSVTRKYTFSASHRLHVESFSEAKNDELFGKCNHPYGHGHNYEIYITVHGPVDPESGFAVDTSALDQLVSKHVLEIFHLKNMNSDVKAFRTTVPTTENLGVEIRRLLGQSWAEKFPGEWPIFEKLRIYETERNIFEVRNEKA